MAKDKIKKQQPSAEEIWKDPRFSHLVNDPRFKGIPKSQKKVKIDKRFQSMFKDEKFKVKESVDKYGRKSKKSSTENLKKYYDIDSEEEVEEDQEKEQKAMLKDDSSSSDESIPGKDEDDEDVTGKVKTRLQDLEIDYARGEGNILTDSSSDDDSGEEEEGEEVFIDHVWGELDADTERTEDSTNRLAICNMDWDRIRAVDIMVLLNSFLNAGSTIKSVTIYPSEFGKERMKEEERMGPQELTAKIEEDSEDDEEDDEEKQVEKLREYQLNRLKYYYGVVSCDNVDTADKLYKECDGMEYESTSNKLDLRFIPDEMEFEDDPKEHITELPDLSKYEPRIFTTTALTQANVELTWDENDLDRREFNEKLMNGKMDKLSEGEMKKYVACSSSEEEVDEEEEVEKEEEEEEEEKPKKSKKQNSIDKYKALLNEIKEKEEKAKQDKIEMEFSWKVNADGEEKNDSEEKRDDSNANPFEKILEKHKEKRKKRKELKKKKKVNADGEEEDESSEDDLPYGVDLEDPFFKDAYDEGEFDLKSKKKSKNKKTSENEEKDDEEESKRKAELALLLEEPDDDKAHFNLAKIQESEIDLQKVSKSKRKRILKKSKKEIEASKIKFDDGFKINAEDNRFASIFSNPEYNIDPTNPSFKKTKGMETLIHEKLKKRSSDDPEAGRVEAKKPKTDTATTMLIKSIKRKVNSI